MTMLAPSDAFSHALRGSLCRVIGFPTGPTELAVGRWAAEADRSDDVVLDLCQGATVDIGCGPGRMTHALLVRGQPALGIDVVSEAIEQTRARGGAALRRDVFAELPGEGRWDTALLADGNIGIGGDPVRLLRRAAELIGAAGRVVVDLDPPGRPIEIHRVALEVGGVRTPRFRWATVPADQLELLADAVAFRVVDAVTADGRHVATLAKGRP